MTPYFSAKEGSNEQSREPHCIAAHDVRLWVVCVTGAEAEYGGQTRHEYGHLWS